MIWRVLPSGDYENSTLLYVLEKYASLGSYLAQHSFAAMELLVAAGFQISHSTVHTSMRTVEELVRWLDGLFGSTETSQAVSAVLALAHREINRDSIDNEAGLIQTVGRLLGVVRVVVLFAFLQAVTYERMPLPTNPVVDSQFQPQSPYGTFQIFPLQPLVFNVAHFSRYATAAYGKQFMTILGIKPKLQKQLQEEAFTNHVSFAHHTNIRLEDILFSSEPSIIDLPPAPGLHALVHYIIADHKLKCIVLTLRGTLGLSDTLTDMLCDYSDIPLPQQRGGFKTHSGMLESARMIADQSSVVHQELLAALNRYKGYGLILCGHSLGGGVASLLSVFWATPVPKPKLVKRPQHLGVAGDDEVAPDTFTLPGPMFVTSKSSGLPRGRPIHCFAYAVPCVASTPLLQYTRLGLVTSVASYSDIVTTLSLGLLHDFKVVAATLAQENVGVAESIIRKVVETQKKRVSLHEWFWALICSMRTEMGHEKLYPPGEVYYMEDVARYATDYGNPDMVLFRCLDVQSRFGEIRFSRGMFLQHNPGVYEDRIESIVNKLPLGL
ncbi:alpha/beta-hydrolase [Ramicandelaber brevisporus]|nr:alpha/beta-hydrolase [Ramicandelaber brevisporus]